MRSIQRALTLAVVLLGLAALGSSKAMVEAQRQIDHGEFDRALATLDGALDSEKDLPTVGQLQVLRAVAFVALGEPQKVDAALIAALEADPLLPVDEERIPPRVIDALATARSEAGGTLKVTTAFGTSKVVIDGQFVGTTPVEPKLSVGRHSVEVESPHGTIRKDVVMKAHGREQLALTDLEPSPNQTAAATSPMNGEATPTASTTASGHPLRTALGWSGLGLGALLGAGAFVEWQSSNAHLRALVNGDGLGGKTPQAFADEGANQRNLAAGLGAAAIALAGAGAILLLSGGEQAPAKLVWIPGEYVGIAARLRIR